MSTKTLLVPGTGGCKLMMDKKSIGHPAVLNAKVWLINTAGGSLDGLEKQLSMEHTVGIAKPTKTCLLPGKDIVPGDALTVAYNQVLPWVDEQFQYDWRGDLEYSAERLLKHLKEHRPQNGRWKLVTHSQGGLVALVASKMYAAKSGGAADAFSRLVSHLVMVAPPVFGTLDSANALAMGETLGKKAHASFKKIAGTWPALYQMLPDWYALRTPSGDYSQYGFFHEETWAKYPWIQTQLLKRAWTIRKRYLLEPITHLSNIHYSFVLATNSKTWNHAILGSDGKLMFPEPNRAGDSLVPYKITQSRMPSVARHRCHIIGPEEPIAVHSMMLSDDFVASIVRQEFSS